MKPPLVETVEVLGPATLRIRWGTGEVLPVDLAATISRFLSLAPLRDPNVFRQASVGLWGHSVRWNDEVDLGADDLYQQSKVQAGEPSPEQFDAWMRLHSLSLTTAAEALGLSRRMVAHYRTGSRPIPKTVWLACKGWEALRLAA